MDVVFKVDKIAVKNRYGKSAGKTAVNQRITPSIKEFENLAETESVTPKKISKRKMKISLRREVKFLEICIISLFYYPLKKIMVYDTIFIWIYLI